MGTAWRSAFAVVPGEVGQMIPQDGQLAPARGLAWGLMLSIAFWSALLLAVGLA